MGYPLPIAVYAYLTLPLLIIGVLVCLIGIPRKSWLSKKKRAVGVFLLALTVLIHGIFITGAATFGPKSVMTAEIITFRCIYNQPCDTAILSTNKGYLDNVRLPQPVDMDTFYQENHNFVTLQLSLWDAKIHWIRTDNTSPPTIVGHRPTVSYYAVAEVLIGAALFFLAWLVWREAKRRRLVARNISV